MLYFTQTYIVIIFIISKETFPCIIFLIYQSLNYIAWLMNTSDRMASIFSLTLKKRESIIFSDLFLSVRIEKVTNLSLDIQFLVHLYLTRHFDVSNFVNILFIRILFFLRVSFAHYLRMTMI